MDSQEEKLIRNWSDSLEEEIAVGLVLTDDDRSKAFEAFADQLCALAPRVQIRKEHRRGAELPAFLIGSGISYHAVPSDKEIEPFLDALRPGGDETGTGMSKISGVERILLPAQFDLYIAMFCTYCPVAVRKMVALAAGSPPIQLRIIDGFLFEEHAKAVGVRSAPTLLLDGTYRWTGEIDVQEVVDMAIKRDPETLSADFFERMLGEGEAERLAKMMVEYGRIFPAFFELLVHEKWPVRLGAMVAVETIAEEDADLAGQIADPLWERLGQAGDAAKGDILYIVGETGDESMIPKIDAFLIENPAKELKEAAVEAISRIRSQIRQKAP